MSSSAPPSSRTAAPLPSVGAPALALHGVHFRYDGAPLLEGLSLEIGAGEMVGLLGRNGCGKTTALRLITGTRRPQAGVVRVGGRDRASWGRRELARRLALVPQELQVAFDFTAEELVLLGRGPHMGWLRGHTRADIEAARGAMRAVGIEQFAARPYRQLSGGEQQRVALASWRWPRSRPCSCWTSRRTTSTWRSSRCSSRCWPASRGRAGWARWS
ncbi:MAG: ABC transporter ATP-binding protein [Chloroflexota bacterium]|nr:ABC transporter ATP-binding protein [Chloroflexota bacterium]